MVYCFLKNKGYDINAFLDHFDDIRKSGVDL